MASLTWIFWDWGKVKNSVNEVESLKKQLIKSRKILEDNIGLDLKAAILNLEATEKNIPTTKKAIEQAMENLRVSRERYKAQMTTSTEVLDAQTLLSNMIKIYQVSKSFGASAALQDLDLKVREGEFVFIAGPSGAGKTTLLRLLFGSEQPTSGQILINGINLTRIKRAKLDLLRRKIGFVFQDFKLINTQTVFQNVALALEVIQERPSIIRKKTRQALKAVGLGKREKAFPLQLSGGEQQRVAIARAIINEPLILLADEPTGNLDPKITRDIMVLFRSINLKGTTLVIATHSQELLSNTDHRIIFLKQGRVDYETTP